MEYRKAQPDDISELPVYFRSHLNNDLFVFLCREGESYAGCCFLYVSEKPPNPSFLKGKTGTVMNVYTRPEFRNKGIASALMKMLLDEAARMELDFVELKAIPHNYCASETQSDFSSE